MTLVVITGAAGHVGANLVRALLAHGHRVRTLVHRDQRALEGLDVEITTGDLCDQESLLRAFKDAELVYHAAAYISLLGDEWPRLEAVNIFGTRNVVGACLQCGVQRLVHWVDVRDVADGALQAAVRAPSGERYILSGHWASLSDLAELAEEIVGLRVPRFVFPLWLARLGAPFAAALGQLTGGRPLYTPAALKPLSGNYRISHERATRDLDYHPRPLGETMVDTWQWFENHRALWPLSGEPGLEMT
ncbi:MAG: NAD-dependent epimerase/dehydratase family protein [Anaerolineae bacterium]|jgi:nucleoside-diphosphate-sugar epimerase